MLYGQNVTFCSEDCLTKLVKPPPKHSALPKDFKIRNEFRHIHEVTVPEGHTIITHISTPFNTENTNFKGELTIFLCTGNKALENRSYILCHFHSFVEQFSVGIFISKADLLPLEILPGTSYSEEHKVYLDSLYTTSIVQLALIHALSKHEEENIDSLLSHSKNE